MPSNFSNPVDLGTLANTGSAATSVVTAGVGAPIGSLVIMLAHHATAGGITFGTCVDSRSNTYTLVAQQQGGSTVREAMYFSVLTTALQAADTITVNLVGGTAPNRAARAFYVTGPAASPADKLVQNTINTQSVVTTATTATLSQADELVVVMFGGGTTAAMFPAAITSGYTQWGDLAPATTAGMASAWQIVSATTGVAATNTWHATVASSAWILSTFKAVVGNTYTKTGMGAIG